MNNIAPIGIFDSGIGGLTVVREVRRLLPQENIIYVGDTARVPYGSRKKEEIISFMHQNMRFFRQKGVKMVIIACNTTTANAYQEAIKTYDIPIVPMDTAIKQALMVSPHRKIGIIATESTVANRMHAKSAESISPGTAVYAKACPLFVPYIEKGIFEGEEIEKIVAEYMTTFQDKDIEALILGCTHYPLIREVLRKSLPAGVAIVNPAEATVKKAAEILLRDNLRNKNTGKIYMDMCFSAGIGKAEKMVRKILPDDLALLDFHQVDLSVY